MNIYELKKKQLKLMGAEISASELVTPWNRAMEYINKSNYLKAPVSTKFHLSVTGGLLIHSVCVTELALRIHGVTPLNLPREQILAAGLLHDVARAGFCSDSGDLQPRYIPNPRYHGTPTKWVGPYEYNEFRPAFKDRDLSALLVAQWGFPWTVIQAVLIHDGPYIPANDDYSQKSCPLAALIQAADTLHAQQFETPDGIIPYDGDEL